MANYNSFFLLTTHFPEPRRPGYLFLLGAALLLSTATAMVAAPAEGRIVARYPVPGDGGFDYVTFDAKSKRLFLSHATKVDVVDSETGKVLGVIGDTPGVHGVALANPFHVGFTSNGAENKVTMFDTRTLRVIRKIDVGKGPDGIYYHPGTRRVFTNNHGSHDITAIDAKSGKVVGTVKIGGDGEQAVFDRGLIYVNSEDTNEVVVFDPQTLAVTRRLPLGGVAQTPTGLAIDAKNQRLFVACRKEPKLLVMDAVSGRVLTSLPIGGASDWAEFDGGRVYVSTGEGILNVFRQKGSADEYEDAGAVRTQPSAKTMALDRRSGRIFLPAGEYQFTPAAEAGKPPRRSIKAGSFVVLVVRVQD